jgi:hypothetical protein
LSNPRILVTTDIAAVFIISGAATEDKLRAAKNRIRHLSKQGRITNYGGATRAARWDLYELARAQGGQTTILPLS